jgi:Ni/Co efflux regulator RcnB
MEAANSLSWECPLVDHDRIKVMKKLVIALLALAPITAVYAAPQASDPSSEPPAPQHAQNGKRKANDATGSESVQQQAQAAKKKKTAASSSADDTAAPKQGS